MSSIFPPRLIKYNLRTQSDFLRNSVNSSKYGLNLVKFFSSKAWQMVPMEIKILKSLEDFRNKIRRNFVLGYVNLVWLWDIGLTVRIRKFCLISSAMKYLLCWHWAAQSQHVGTAMVCEIGTGLTIIATEQC